MATMLDPKMFARVAPPPLSPPVINLVTSARNPEPVDPMTGKPARWQYGFAFEPLPNQDPQNQDPRLSTADNDVDPSPTVETAPWWAEVIDKCSTIGFEAHDFAARALAGLAAATPKAVEKEFWDGTIAQANSWPNLFLSMPAVANRGVGFGPIIINPTPGTAVDLVEAFELLEGAIGDCGAGGRGMIHAAPQATPNFLGVRREGNLLLTQRDTIVCSGSGYSGAGPVGASGATPTNTLCWLYATSIPIVYLDDPYIESPGDEVNPAGDVRIMTEMLDRPTYPTGEPGDDSILRRLYEPVARPFDNDLSAEDRAAVNRQRLDEMFHSYFVDRATNTVHARARRTVAATWDGICHFACLVDITLVTTGA